MAPGIRRVAPAIFGCVLVAACASGPAPASPGSPAPSASSVQASAPIAASPGSAGSPEPRSPAAAAPTGPPACTEATFAYDPSSQAMLLLNCVDQTDPGSVEQVWSWDGSAWSLVDDGGPPATVVTGVAYDPQRRAAVRYGGLPLDSNDCSTETWEWSAAGWASKDVDPPTVCDHMFMVHEATHQRSLLFGGGDDAGNLITETWAASMLRWTPATGRSWWPPAPPASTSG